MHVSNRVSYAYLRMYDVRRSGWIYSPGGSLIALESARKPGIARCDAVVFDRNRDRAPVAQQHYQALGACDAGVQQVALEQSIVLGEQGDDHAGVLGALRFVDRDRVRQRQLIEQPEIICNIALVVLAHRQQLSDWVDRYDLANIAVVDLEIIVITQLWMDILRERLD